MPYPDNIWCCLEGTTYQGNLVYRHPRTGEFAWEDREYLVSLPQELEICLRDGQRGEFSCIKPPTK